MGRAKIRRGWDHSVTQDIQGRILKIIRDDGFTYREICMNLGWSYSELMRRLEGRQISIGDAAILCEVMGKKFEWEIKG